MKTEADVVIELCYAVQSIGIGSYLTHFPSLDFDSPTWILFVQGQVALFYRKWGFLSLISTSKFRLEDISEHPLVLIEYLRCLSPLSHDTSSNSFI
jgi:hypothetical protein